MKKLSAIFAAILVLTMALSFTVSAGPLGIVENPPINVPSSTPTIDGTINENEGWSVSALMNYETLGFYWHVNPLTMDGNVRFAWDNDNLYYCGVIRDGLAATHEITGEPIPEGYNSFIYSTGEDWIDVSEDDPNDHYGYDGDVFGIIIDPLETMLYSGYTGNEDYTPWYLIGLFEGDVAKMYRQKVNPGDITDQVQVAGHTTEDGWCFEAAIPWDMIIKDVEDISFGDCVIDKAELLADGSKVALGAMYHDRFLDPEAGEVSTWGRFVTAPTTLATGMSGNGSSGANVLSCGIQLFIDAEVGTNVGGGDDPVDDPTDTTPTTESTPDESTTPNADTTEAVETEEVIVDVTDEKGNVVTDASGNKVTQKVTQKVTTKKQNSGTTTGGSDNAQTLDVMLAVSIGALAVSGIGFVATKKRK